ncbi:MAG: HD domain-containing protein [Parcubacteria group bacterium]|nr:HD domain-containing protein [Parcubacteria group bacterium]
MQKIKASQKDIDIERAITKTVDCINKKNRNSKPLILHSLRVGMKLFELDQPKEVIIAGFLHDLAEDTNCTIEDIKKEFGSNVALLVSALTQEKITDYKERWHVLMEKIKKAGKGAMVIKIVDINDNLIYFPPPLKDKQFVKEIIWKQNFTIESLKPYLSDEKFFKEYCCNFKSAKKITCC